MHLVSYWVDTTHIIICMCVRLVAWFVGFFFAASNGAQSSIILPHLKCLPIACFSAHSRTTVHFSFFSIFVFEINLYYTNHLEYNIFVFIIFCCLFCYRCFLLSLSLSLSISLIYSLTTWDKAPIVVSRICKSFVSYSRDSPLLAPFVSNDNYRMHLCMHLCVVD